MAYTFKQRSDGGFDFYSGNKKTTIEDYAKNTGVNQNALRSTLAQRGDPQSQQIIKQSSIDKIYKAKLPTAINQESKSVDWLGKLVSDRDWKKRAENTARNQAISEYTSKTKDYTSPVVKNYLGQTSASANQLSQNARKAVDYGNKTFTNMKEVAQIGGYVPGFGAAITAAPAIVQGIASRTSNKQLANDINNIRSQVDFNMSSSDFNKLDKDTQNKMRTMQNIGVALSPLDFLGAGGIVKSGIGGLTKSATREALTKGAISQATKTALKQSFKSAAKSAITPTLAGGAISAGAQQYLTGKIDPLQVAKDAVTTGASSLLLSPLSGSSPTLSSFGRTKELAKSLDATTDTAQRRNIIQQIKDNNQANIIAKIPQILDTKPKYDVNKVNQNEAYTLTDYAEMINPSSKFLKDTTNPATITAINELNRQARNAAQTAGIDIITGTPFERQNRIIDFIEQYENAQNPIKAETNVRQLTPEQVKAQLKREREGGFAKIPGGDKTKVTTTKQEQLDVINKLNPMTDEYHTGIRSVNDIKTYKEAFNDPESFAYPDFSKVDGRRAVDTGKITIYSSKPLDKINAQFVTPSKMGASDYASGGKVYSKEVSVNDVAWINGDEGQLVGSTKPRSDSGFAKIPLPKKLADFASRNLDEAPQVAKTETLKNNWREIDNLKFGKDDAVNADMLLEKQSIMREIARVSRSDKELSDILDRAETFKNGGYLGDNANLVYDVSKNPAASKTTQSRAKELYDSITTPIVTKTPTTSPLEQIQPKKTKELSQTINNIIYRDYPELTQVDIDSRFPDGIPKIKPSSIIEVTGLSATEAGIPPRYLSETNGKALDEVAVDMQYKTDGGELTLTGDDVLEAIKSELDSKKILRENPSRIAELRRDPTIIAEAQKVIDDERKYITTQDDVYQPTKEDYDYYNKVISEQSFGEKVADAISPLKQLEVKAPEIIKTTPKKVTKATPQARGFVESVQNAPIVDKAVKKSVAGLYTPKTNDTLMAEAKALLTEGGIIDFKSTKDLDKKVAATMQEAMNQQAAGNHQAAADLFNNLSEHGTELGRGVQAFSLLKNMSPEAVSLSVAGKIKKYNRDNPTRKIPELNGEQQKMVVDKMTEIDLLKDGREKNIALNELENMVSDFIPSTIVDKALTVWKAGLLTSLRTHIRNFVGNTVHGIAEIAKDVPGVGADILMSGKTGQRTLTATTKGISEFASKSTIQQMKDIITKGYDPTEMVQKFDYNRITWGKNPVEQGLKKYTDTVFNLLGAGDKPFYNAAMARSLYNQAGATAINSGKRGNKAFIESLVKNPTEDMIKIAIGDANVATFKDKNAATRVVGQLKQALNTTEAGKLIGGITMPFTGVPTSILGQIVEYSPIGLVKGIDKVGQVMSGEVPELQRLAAQEVGRGVIGTGVFGLGAYLASQGLITGQPKDKEEARQWELENKPRNSIMINGKWRSLNSIGPEAVVFLAGSKLNEELNKEDGSAADYALTLGKDYLDQSFVKGLQSPINALTDPARYGKSYVGSTISSVIPNIIKDVGKAFDPLQREANTVLDYASSTVPGLRNTMLPRRDALGNTMAQEPTGAGAFIDIFNSKTPIKNTVVDELNRLYESGQKGSTPSKMAAKTSVLSQAIEMTPEQLDKFEQATGANIQQQMKDIIATPEYQQADDATKKDILSSITNDIRESGKLDVLSGGDIGTNLNLSADNKIKLQKSIFEKSNENFLEKDGTIYTRNNDGTANATPKIKYEYDLNKATLAQFKSDDNIDGWLKQADLQIKNIYSQMQDKNITPVESIKLQTELDSLLRNKSKYEGYGGFTKGSSSSSGSASSTKQMTIDSSTLDTTNETINKLNSLLRGTQDYTRPTIRKAQLKKITVKGEK